MRDVGRVCVFCASNPGARPHYLAAARTLGAELARRGVGLVYGGARVGLMGALADAVLEGGGEVVGVLPRSLARRELAHEGLTRLMLVDSMHERKAAMTELADAFVVLPGGLGTLEETFEVLTWCQLGIHRKPTGLLNVAGYYDHLLAFLRHAVDERLIREEHGSMLLVDEAPGPLLDRLASQSLPTVRKWLSTSET